MAGKDPWPGGVDWQLPYRSKRAKAPLGAMRGMENLMSRIISLSVLVLAGLASLLACGGGHKNVDLNQPPATQCAPGEHYDGQRCSGPPVARPVKDCSLCSTGLACASVAGVNYCATPVDLNPQQLLENSGRVVSLKAADLRPTGLGLCTTINCFAADESCCNDCSGAQMSFLLPDQHTLIQIFQHGAALSCAAYQIGVNSAKRAGDPLNCPLEPGKYDAIGVLGYSRPMFRLDLVAIQPAQGTER